MEKVGHGLFWLTWTVVMGMLVLMLGLAVVKADHNGLEHRADLWLVQSECGRATVYVDSTVPVVGAQVYLYAMGLSFAGVESQEPLNDVMLHQIAQSWLVGQATGNIPASFGSTYPSGQFPLFSFSFTGAEPKYTQFSIGGRYRTIIVDEEHVLLPGDRTGLVLVPC